MVLPVDAEGKRGGAMATTFKINTHLVFQCEQPNCTIAIQDCVFQRAE
jgi:hypothetical protein